MTTHLYAPSGTACGLTFGGPGWGDDDDVVTDRDEAADVTCAACADAA